MDARGPSQHLESNLITICSNVLKIYTIMENTLEMRLNNAFNDKIIDVIKIPTKKFRKETHKREGKAAPNAPSGTRRPTRNVDVETMLHDELETHGLVEGS